MTLGLKRQKISVVSLYSGCMLYTITLLDLKLIRVEITQDVENYT